MAFPGVDVLVCGAGMAGLCAAASAAEAGARVLVLEKGPRPGGSMRMSGGTVWTAPSMGVMERWVPGGSRVRQRQLVDGIAPGLAWLASLGVPARSPISGERQTGAELDVELLTERLVARIEALGGEVRPGSTLERIDPGGPAVVLATGGFSASSPMRLAHLGPFGDSVLVRGNPHSTGDGLALAIGAGGRATASMSTFYGHTMPAPPADPPPSRWTAVTQYATQDGVLLDLDGRRFMDESLSMQDEVAATRIIRCREGRAVFVVDGALYDDRPLPGRSPARVQPNFRNAVEAGAPSAVADTLEALASAMAAWGVDGAAALATLRGVRRGGRFGAGGGPAGTEAGERPPDRHAAVPCAARPGRDHVHAGRDRGRRRAAGAGSGRRADPGSVRGGRRCGRDVRRRLHGRSRPRAGPGAGRGCGRGGVGSHASRGMTGGNIANVSWGDHIEWGEGSGKLATADDIARSVERWVERDGARRIHFREHEYYRRHGRIVHGTWRSDLFESRSACDENAEILRRGHEAGVPVWLYVTIYDELWLDTEWAWPWDPGTNWLSDYVRDHPEDVLVDREGRERLWGVLDYHADAARAYRVQVVRELLGDRDWDGVFVCTRSQSRPAAHGDAFGFNEGSVRRYREARGSDPRCSESLDLAAWREVRGEGLTRLLRDLRVMTDERGIGLAVGIPRADTMGPPIGNLALDWRTWARDRVVDALVIGQIPEICPSAWIHLWPEASVDGYLADPVRGTGMRPLEVDLDEVFGPVCAATGTELYLSRLHDHPDPELEERLVAEHPHLAGIQYSTFRRDLGAAAADMPWRRTLSWPDGRNAWDPDRGLVRAERP